ncbi:hypothetical protein GCM10027047_03560 [Rhodococcus aerolatus]
MTPPTGTVPDPAAVGSRDELGAALTALRNRAALTVRGASAASGVLHGTLAGWFAGNHVPTPASREGYERLLAACGVADPAARAAWWEAADRARRGARRGDDAPPYKGLEPYQAEDAALFRGRDRAVAVAVAAVLAAVADGSGVVAVVGPSGAGKSSLVRAGLVPALTAPGRPLSGRRVVVVTPGRGGDALATALHELDPPTLLVVDQLEELVARPADEAGPLLERLCARARGRTDELAVVLVLRADFFARAAEEPALLPVLADHQVVVGAMDSAELRDAVVEPARRRGREVDPALVEELLTDLGPSRPGALPLLSHALRHLGRRRGAAHRLRLPRDGFPGRGRRPVGGARLRRARRGRPGDGPLGLPAAGVRRRGGGDPTRRDPRRAGRHDGRGPARRRALRGGAAADPG